MVTESCWQESLGGASPAAHKLRSPGGVALRGLRACPTQDCLEEGRWDFHSVLSLPSKLVWWVFKVSFEMRGLGKGRLSNGVWQTLYLSLQVGIPHHATSC